MKDSSRWNRLDQQLIIINTDSSITIHTFQHNIQTFKTHQYRRNPKVLATPVDTTMDIWESRFKPGTALLVRCLPLNSYYRYCGFTKNQKLRSKAEKVIDVNTQLSILAIRKSTPTLKTFNYEKSLYAIQHRLSTMHIVLDFEHEGVSGIGFRARTLRTWFRKKQVLDRVTNELSWNSCTKTYGNVVLFHGSAKFNVTSRGLKSGPNRLIEARLSKKLTYISTGEYHSSKHCCRCHSRELSGYSYSTLLQDGKVFRPKLSWGVKFCVVCGIHWNRDLNACINLLYIGLYQVYNNGKRPMYFYKPTKKRF